MRPRAPAALMGPFFDLVGFGRLSTLVSRVVGGIDDLVFPWYCMVCERQTDAALCPVCRLGLMEERRRVCKRCAMPVGPNADTSGGCSECRGRRMGFNQVMALGSYQGPLRDLCLLLKNVNNACLAQELATMLLEIHRERLESIKPVAIVPVPLHWRKRVRRGYNQADELATAIAKRIGVPIDRSLKRVVSTEKLAGLGKAERFREMKRAFQAEIRPGWKGKTVLLVDDILTSGATTGAAARALKISGAKGVALAVIGRAEGRR